MYHLNNEELYSIPVPYFFFEIQIDTEHAIIELCIINQLVVNLAT